MAYGMKNILICLFGSSIIEGRIGVEDPCQRWYNIFQAMLSKTFPEKCFPIVNSAVGGESTREIMARFDRDILPYNPDFCIFMAGANNHDCTHPERILAEGEFESLMEDFSKRLPGKTRPVGVVLNPVVDKWHFAARHPAFKEYLREFGGSLDASLAKERNQARSFYTEHRWPYLDLYSLMSGHPSRYLLESDGIHMNRAGHELFGQKMFGIFKNILTNQT